jgi:hypothetical protein
MNCCKQKIKVLNHRETKTYLTLILKTFLNKTHSLILRNNRKNENNNNNNNNIQLLGRDFLGI